MSGSLESISWTRSGHLAGVEVLSGFADARPWRWFHETYSFCAAEAAASNWRYRRGEYFLNDGSVMLLEPGETHRNIVVHKPADFKVLLVSADAFGELTRELGAPTTAHFSSAQVDRADLFALIWRLCLAIEAGASPLAQQGLLTQVVARLAAHAERRPPPPSGVEEPRAIARAKAYLEHRCRDAVSLDELAEVAGLTRFRLAQAFTRAVGLPPHAWQILVRIERSRELLAQGMSAAAAASESGFCDQAHFSRHFRRIMRVTPGDYRRGARAAPALRSTP
jgi:AraC-like DNA-binding protein